MKILAIDAALGGFSAALDAGSGTPSFVDSGGRQDALEAGIGHIDDLLRAAGLRLDQLDRLAVGLGPGSFTGVRIAVAYAKSLAYGSGVPLIGISSYDALEPDDPPLPILTVVRGRRDVICARMRDATSERSACGRTADVLDRLLGWPPSALTVTGNTEDVLSETAERGWTVRVLAARATVPAIAIAQLARTRDPSASLHALAPDYGEAPAVTQPARR